MMHKFQLMPFVRQCIDTYPYASAVLATLAFVTLLVGTNGFAGVRRAIHNAQQRAEDRRLAREAGRYVWCFSHYAGSEGRKAIYGYWSGYRKQAILRVYDAPTQLLSLKRQRKECFRTWRQAADATDDIALNYPNVMVNHWSMPEEGADEETYRQAVLSAVLDSLVQSYRHKNATPAEEVAPDRWCMSRIHTSEATVYHVPHKLGAREAVEEVLNQLPDRSHLNHYMLDGTECFASNNDAIDWMKKYWFLPPEGTTVTGYLNSVTEWLEKEEVQTQ
ncbi:MAG: hypothetical protein R3A44_30775 [Caldilineaceae bacterium]